MRSDCRWLALSDWVIGPSSASSLHTGRCACERKSRAALCRSASSEFTASLTELWPFWSFGSSFYNISSRRKQAEFKLWRRAQRRSGDEPPVCPLWQDRVPDGESQLPGQGGNFSLGINQTFLCVKQNDENSLTHRNACKLEVGHVNGEVRKTHLSNLFKLHACKNTGSLYITTLWVQRKCGLFKMV